MSHASQPASRRPRILITRTRHQASALAESLRKLGTEPILVPMIEVIPPTTFDELDRAIGMLDGSANEFDWTIFTSANAAVALADRARYLHTQVHLRRIAAIGPATAAAIAKTGLTLPTEPVLVPDEYVAESLARALLLSCDSPQRFLLIRAEEARDELPSQLIAAGHTVHIAVAYRNLTPEGTLPALQQIFAAPESYPQIITFTSSSTARNLVGLLGQLGRTIPTGVALASIGPITSATLRELGYEPTFEAREPTIESLVSAIAGHLSQT